MVSAASVFSVAGAVVDAVAEVFEAVLVEAGVSTLLLAVAVDATVAVSYTHLTLPTRCSV